MLSRCLNSVSYFEFLPFSGTRLTIQQVCYMTCVSAFCSVAFRFSKLGQYDLNSTDST